MDESDINVTSLYESKAFYNVLSNSSFSCAGQTAFSMGIDVCKYPEIEYALLIMFSYQQNVVSSTSISVI